MTTNLQHLKDALSIDKSISDGIEDSKLNLVLDELAKKLDGYSPTFVDDHGISAKALRNGIRVGIKFMQNGKFSSIAKNPIIFSKKAMISAAEREARSAAKRKEAEDKAKRKARLAYERAQRTGNYKLFDVVKQVYNASYKGTKRAQLAFNILGMKSRLCREEYIPDDFLHKIIINGQVVCYDIRDFIVSDDRHMISIEDTKSAEADEAAETDGSIESKTMEVEIPKSDQQIIISHIRKSTALHKRANYMKILTDVVPSKDLILSTRYVLSDDVAPIVVKSGMIGVSAAVITEHYDNLGKIGPEPRDADSDEEFSARTAERERQAVIHSRKTGYVVRLRELGDDSLLLPREYLGFPEVVHGIRDDQVMLPNDFKATWKKHNQHIRLIPVELQEIGKIYVHPVGAVMHIGKDGYDLATLSNAMMRENPTGRYSILSRHSVKVPGRFVDSELEFVDEPIDIFKIEDTRGNPIPYGILPDGITEIELIIKYRESFKVINNKLGFIDDVKFNFLKTNGYRASADLIRNGTTEETIESAELVRSALEQLNETMYSEVMLLFNEVFQQSYLEGKPELPKTDMEKRSMIHDAASNLYNAANGNVETAVRLLSALKLPSEEDSKRKTDPFAFVNHVALKIRDIFKRYVAEEILAVVDIQLPFIMAAVKSYDRNDTTFRSAERSLNIFTTILSKIDSIDDYMMDVVDHFMDSRYYDSVRDEVKKIGDTSLVSDYENIIIVLDRQSAEDKSATTDEDDEEYEYDDDDY